MYKRFNNYKFTTKGFHLQTRNLSFVLKIVKTTPQGRFLGYRNSINSLNFEMYGKDKVLKISRMRQRLHRH